MDALDRRSRGLIPGLRMAGIAVALAVALGACSASTASPSPAGTSTAPSVAPADSSGPAESGVESPPEAILLGISKTRSAKIRISPQDIGRIPRSNGSGRKVTMPH